MKPLAASLVALVGMALPVSVLACSICRCGDPTFSALGREGVSLPGLRLAVDWEEVRKSQGSRDGEFSSILEHRWTLLGAWGVSDRLSFFLRLPYAERSLLEVEDGAAEREHASGIADPEITAQLRLWSSPFEGDVGIRTSVFVVGGLKTAWGENDRSGSDGRLDEHAQPGSGSTDWVLGLSGLHQLDRASAVFASVHYRSTGRNEFGYRYGSALLLNLAYEHKLGSRWDAVIEANYRDSGRDVVDREGRRDHDTGGAIAYLTPRVLFDAGHGWVLRASAQWPLSRSGLNGDQREQPVWNLGLTRLIGP